MSEGRTADRSIGPAEASVKRYLALILLARLVLPDCSHSGEEKAPTFDFDRYKPSSIAAIMREHAYAAEEQKTPEGKDPKGLIAITAKSFPYKVAVVYTGKKRDIQKEARTLIEHWANTLKKPGAPDAFKHEILVREDGKEYWIPIQTVLLPYLADEIEPGDRFDLYLMWLGYIREGKSDGRWIFIANEFQAMD